MVYEIKHDAGLVCPKCGVDSACQCGVAPIDRALFVQQLMPALGILRACIVANEASDAGELELTYPMEAAADLVQAATVMLDRLSTPSFRRALKLMAASMGPRTQPTPPQPPKPGRRARNRSSTAQIDGDNVVSLVGGTGIEPVTPAV